MAKDDAGFQTERSMTIPATTPADGLAQQDARFAINGAIAYGRMGIKEPPAGHWLTEYWHIGRQLAKLGETSAWDNQTPVATTEPDLDALEAEWAPYAHDLGSAAIIVGLIARIRVLSLATPSPGKAPEPVAWIRPDELAKAKSAPHLCRVEPTRRMADFVPLYTSHGKVQKPIYQVTCSPSGERWQDVTEEEYNITGKIHRRMLYASPGKADAEDAARYRS